VELHSANETRTDWLRFETRRPFTKPTRRGRIIFQMLNELANADNGLQRSEKDGNTDNGCFFCNSQYATLDLLINATGIRFRTALSNRRSAAAKTRSRCLEV